MAKATVRIQRFTGSQTVLINSTIASATAIDYRNASGGAIKVESTIASITFTFYGCDTIDGTFVPLYTTGGVAVTSTGPGGAACIIDIPTACFGVPFLKLKGNADDGESITVLTKS